MKVMISALLISASMFASGDVPDIHPLGAEWQINDFSMYVAEKQYEEESAAPDLTEEEKALCEEACNEEVCSCITPVTYIGEFQAYAYCTCSECCSPEWDGFTYAETVPEEGRTVAVDPAIIPLGTKLAIEYPDGSYRELIAEDTGAGIKGNKLDVFIADHARALQHGIQSVKVYRED